MLSQMPEYSEQVVRSFRISNGVTVDIANKYGKIQVITTGTDSVKFIIDFRIRAKDDAKLQKLKQTVDFEFTPGQSFLIARTKIGDGGSDVIKDIVDIAGTYLSTTSSVVINYTIMIPAGTPLRIDNKFGDVYFDDLAGDFNLVLSYGDLTCNRLTGKSEIRITSGDAEINYSREGLVYLSYGNMHIRDAGTLTAETRSSNFTVDRTENLKINSRRDKLILSDLGSLTGESYFSRINGGVLRGDLTFSSRYGDLSMDNIRRGFSRINITSEFTDVALGFEKPMLLNFELLHHQDVVFVYPKNLASLKTSVSNADARLFQTKGTFGTGTPEADLILNIPRRCNLTIFYR